MPDGEGEVADEWEAFVAREMARQRAESGEWLATVGPGRAGAPDGPQGGPAPRRRRRRRVAVIAGVTAAAVLLGAGAFAWSTRDNGPGGSGAASQDAAGSVYVPVIEPAPAASSAAPSTAPPAAPTGPDVPSGPPTALPDGAATSIPPGARKAASAPPIAAERAFPEKRVSLPSGDVFELADVYTPRECREMMSAQLVSVIDDGRTCAQMIVALYTDPGRRIQITIAVASFTEVSHAHVAFAMNSLDPIAYGVGALDPVPGSDVPLPPREAPGGFGQAVAVRSVVFGISLWSDGRNEDSAAIHTPARELLRYVFDRVAAYEEGTART
ncbi:hypothetical protein [Yinghuangia soli]|uniref:Uncharacterized protein n=1 Tax=Yinghuangia soli TaxID=2908204 RepID=A0AA41Q1I5_9ACTN|nr:hypothetical protein [Yinghuangia soli]MCF2529477.1 hypothetical protein [Yinghuangia soli]